MKAINLKLDMRTISGIHFLLNSTEFNVGVSFIKKYNPSFSKLNFKEAEIWINELDLISDMDLIEICRKVSFHYIKQNVNVLFMVIIMANAILVTDLIHQFQFLACF